MEKEIDHEYTNHIVCPYCGHVERESQEIAGNEEDGDCECGECGRTFLWSIHVDITYSTESIPDPRPAPAKEDKQ